MLLGTLGLVNLVRKCFEQQKQQVASSKAQPVHQGKEVHSDSAAIKMAAQAEQSTGPSRMDVDTHYTANGSEEWTQEEMTFMRAALEQAKVALHRREVPVGCVIARDGRIVAKGFNLTNELRNATRHAEFQAIDEVLRQSEGDLAAAEFRRCQLYVTCEPCIMCAGALSLVGMGRVYFGCPNDKFGGCGSILAINEQGCGQCGRDCGGESSGGYSGPPLPEHGGGFERRGGLFADQAIQLLQDFYLAGNPKAPKPARPVVDVPPWELELEQQQQQQQPRVNGNRQEHQGRQRDSNKQQQQYNGARGGLAAAAAVQ